ncbi:MAG: hypothetical protein V4629_10490, partial [Pseudomonadota bacterium]
MIASQISSKKFTDLKANITPEKVNATRKTTSFLTKIISVSSVLLVLIEPLRTRSLRKTTHQDHPHMSPSKIAELDVLSGNKLKELSSQIKGAPNDLESYTYVSRVLAIIEQETINARKELSEKMPILLKYDFSSVFLFKTRALAFLATERVKFEDVASRDEVSIITLLKNIINKINITFNTNFIIEQDPQESTEDINAFEILNQPQIVEIFLNENEIYDPAKTLRENLILVTKNSSSFKSEKIFGLCFSIDQANSEFYSSYTKCYQKSNARKFCLSPYMFQNSTHFKIFQANLKELISDLKTTNTLNIFEKFIFNNFKNVKNTAAIQVPAELFRDHKKIYSGIPVSNI